MAMSDKVRMRFVRSYQIYKQGQEYEFNAGVARSLELIRVAVRTDTPQMNAAVAPPPAAERAEAPAAKAARKRRRNV